MDVVYTHKQDVVPSSHPAIVYMQYMGVQLSEFCDEAGLLATLSALRNVALTLQSALRIGCTHSDIRCANIAVSKSGTGVLIDVMEFMMASKDDIGYTHLHAVLRDVLHHFAIPLSDDIQTLISTMQKSYKKVYKKPLATDVMAAFEAIVAHVTWSTAAGGEKKRLKRRFHSKKSASKSRRCRRRSFKRVMQSR